MGRSEQRPLGYGEALRAVGAWLDERSPTYFTVFETTDGFTVVITGEGGLPAPEETHFRYGVLGQQVEQMRRNRRARKAHTPAPVPLFDTSRQDFFRALGFELDDAGAESVVIDKLEDRLTVSYAYVDPAADFSWHKRMVVLDKRDIEKVLNAAKNRRQPEQSAGLFGGWRKPARSPSTR